MENPKILLDMINPNTKAKYLAFPQNCPHCDCENLAAETGLEFDLRQCWRTVRCIDCGQRWRETYSLADIEEIV